MELLTLKISGTPLNPPPGLPTPGFGMTEKILNNAVTIFLIAGVVVSLLTIVWGGITWITSGGDKQKLASARARITWAIIGLVIMFVAYAVILVFNNLFGINLCEWCGKSI